MNPYEFVRKYGCSDCGAVMMCACDEEFANRFLPHQISTGTELRTQQRVPVTGGFQPDTCNTCRGLPEEAHPKAQIRGHSTKIRRYYWREIFMETTRRFDEWATAHGVERAGLGFDKPYIEERERIERDVVGEIQEQHVRQPKYSFREDSQSEVIDRNGVEVVNLKAEYVHGRKEKAAVLYEGRRCTVEEFASRYFESQGCEVLVTESRPFHVLFAVFLWPIVQDPDDPVVEVRGFGERSAFDSGEEGVQIWTDIPKDFGSPGYWGRRGSVVESWLSEIVVGQASTARVFEELLPGAFELRQYLWAHAAQDLQRARRILRVLPAEALREILAYLAGDYWRRYCGWPDLLVSEAEGFYFVEVKSSKDKLSEDQKRWIESNTEILGLPFKLLKIHKARSAKEGQTGPPNGRPRSPH